MPWGRAAQDPAGPSPRIQVQDNGLASSSEKRVGADEKGVWKGHGSSRGDGWCRWNTGANYTRQGNGRGKGVSSHLECMQ